MSTYTPPYQLTDAILRLSTEIAATVKEITVRGNLSAQPQLHRANRIRSVHSSLAIEHNSLTLDQVTALLDGKRVLAPQQEVWEVQNAFRAYDLLPSLDPYSIDDLLKVHRVMMDGMGLSWAQVHSAIQVSAFMQGISSFMPVRPPNMSRKPCSSSLNGCETRLRIRSSLPASFIMSLSSSILLRMETAEQGDFGKR